MQESVRKLADGWSVRTFDRTPESTSPVAAWEHDEYPLLLIIKEDEALETYYRCTFKITGDHDEHPHKQLFETPRLETEDGAKAMAAAIACKPMDYARKFF